MTPFKIHDIVRIRDDEETKSDIKMFYGSEYAENNIIGQIGRVLRISIDETQVELHLQNGTKRFFDNQLVESLPFYPNESEERSRLRALVIRIKEDAMEDIKLSPVLEQAFQHFLFHADATIGEHDVTALHVACQNGDVNAVKLLIAHGASLEREDSYGNRAVHYAVMKNLPGVLKLLISQGARLDCVNNKQQTPYHLAASNNRFPDCLAVLMASPQSSFDVNSQDREGHTALHLISKLGIKRTEKLQEFARLFKKMMLLRGVDFSLKNNQGLTVLQTAAEVGNLWVLKCLLNFNGKSMMVEEMCEDCHSPNSPTSIYLACKAGHYEVAKCLLEFFMNHLHGQRSAQFQATFSMVKWAERSLYIPLVCAIKEDHYAIVELLADSPIKNINAQDRNGDSAMLMATRRIGCTQKFPDGSAPAISKIYNDMKTYLPTKAEPALAIILFLITKGAILNEEESQNKIIINTLHEYLNVKPDSMNELPHNPLSDLVVLSEAQKSANTTDDVVQTSPTAQSTTPFQIIEHYERGNIVTSVRNGLGHRCGEKKCTKIFECQHCQGYREKKRRWRMVLMKMGQKGKATFRFLVWTKRYKCTNLKRAQRCLPQTEKNLFC